MSNTGRGSGRRGRPSVYANPQEAHQARLTQNRARYHLQRHGFQVNRPADFRIEQPMLRTTVALNTPPAIGLQVSPEIRIPVDNEATVVFDDSVEDHPLQSFEPASPDREDSDNDEQELKEAIAAIHTQEAAVAQETKEYEDAITEQLARENATAIFTLQNASRMRENSLPDGCDSIRGASSAHESLPSPSPSTTSQIRATKSSSNLSIRSRNFSTASRSQTRSPAHQNTLMP